MLSQNFKCEIQNSQNCFENRTIFKNSTFNKNCIWNILQTELYIHISKCHQIPKSVYINSKISSYTHYLTTHVHLGSKSWFTSRLAKILSMLKADDFFTSTPNCFVPDSLDMLRTKNPNQFSFNYITSFPKKRSKFSSPWILAQGSQLKDCNGLSWGDDFLASVILGHEAVLKSHVFKTSWKRRPIH